MSEGPPIEMENILQRLEKGARLTDRLQSPESANPFDQLRNPRRAVYDIADEVILAGGTYADFQNAAQNPLEEYKAAQDDTMRDWLQENGPLIRDGCAQMAAVATVRPDLLHPDAQPTNADFIRTDLPKMMKMIADPSGPRWDTSQLALSAIGPTAYAGLTKHKGIAGDVGALFVQTVDMLDQVGDGLWWGPHNLTGRTIEELDNRGVPYQLTGTANSQTVASVPRMGFLPRRVFPPQNPEISIGAAIGQPMLPALIGF